MRYKFYSIFASLFIVSSFCSGAASANVLTYDTSDPLYMLKIQPL